MQKRSKGRLTQSLSKNPKVVVFVSLAFLGIFAVVGFLQLQTPSSITVHTADVSESENSDSSKDDEQNTIMVDVSGQVLNPGMYKLFLKDPRVNDAIEASGGLLEDADRESINLAQKVEDGEKIYIPKIGEIPAESTSQKTTNTSTGPDSETEKKSGLVNINTASAEELQTLSGIGEATAQAIIKDREQNGRFKSKQDIMRVSGIGEKKYAKIESSICV